MNIHQIGETPFDPDAAGTLPHERLALLLYASHFSYDERGRYRPWVPGGNSHMQIDRLREALRLLEDIGFNDLVGALSEARHALRELSKDHPALPRINAVLSTATEPRAALSKDASDGR